MYEIRYTGLNFGDNVNQTLNTSSGDETSMEVGGLEEFANYTIEVRAYTAVGPGPYSSPMDVMTLSDSKHFYLLYTCICVCMLSLFVCSTVPSGSVTNLNVTETQSTSVELSWGPVNQRDQNGIILYYRIYYQLDGSSDTYIITNVTERVSDVY